MIEKKIYICEGCRHEYDDAKQCKACEEKHISALYIESAKYEPNRGFPVSIVVEDTFGGKRKTYVEA